MLHMICDTWTCGDLEIWMVQWRILRYCVCHATCIGVESAEVVSHEQAVIHVGCRHVPARVDTCPVRAMLVWDTRQARVRWHTPHTRWHACDTRDMERWVTHMHGGVSNSSGRCADAGGGHPVVLASTRCNAVRADVTGMEVCDWFKRSCKEFVRK